MSTELGLRNVAFLVDDLQPALDGLAADGYGLLSGVGQYEHIWRMAHVRGELLAQLRGRADAASESSG